MQEAEKNETEIQARLLELKNSLTNMEKERTPLEEILST